MHDVGVDQDLAAADFLQRAGELLERVAPEVNWPNLRRRVLDGLAIGARTYGATAYLGRDNALEGQDEGRDGIAYCLMEHLDALAREPVDVASDVTMHLLAAAVSFAEAHQHLAAARHARID